MVHLLCEGMGIRAISRFTELDAKTILNVLETVGYKAVRFLDLKVRDVQAKLVQVDELINFVYSRGQNTPKEETQRGDFATYLSVDRDSKLIINWRVGKRTAEDVYPFLYQLKKRVPNRFQLTTDGWQAYAGYGGAVRTVFGVNIDYATETKLFGKEYPTLGNRVSPMTILGVKKVRKINKPVMRLATTSHVERTNLSVRIFNRRFTRLTLGFSKKLANLEYAVALFVWHFNFVRIHSAHGKTPAQAAGIASSPMTIKDFLALNLVD